MEFQVLFFETLPAQAAQLYGNDVAFVHVDCDESKSAVAVKARNTHYGTMWVLLNPSPGSLGLYLGEKPVHAISGVVEITLTEFWSELFKYKNGQWDVFAKYANDRDMSTALRDSVLEFITSVMTLADVVPGNDARKFIKSFQPDVKCDNLAQGRAIKMTGDATNSTRKDFVLMIVPVTTFEQLPPIKSLSGYERESRFNFIEHWDSLMSMKKGLDNVNGYVCYAIYGGTDYINPNVSTGNIIKDKWRDFNKVKGGLDRCDVARPVGYAICGYQSLTEKVQDDFAYRGGATMKSNFGFDDGLLISSLAVHPEFRRIGVATNLIQHCLLDSRINSWALVNIENVEACKAFSKAGFKNPKTVKLIRKISDADLTDLPDEPDNDYILMSMSVKDINDLKII